MRSLWDAVNSVGSLLHADADLGRRWPSRLGTTPSSSARRLSVLAFYVGQHAFFFRHSALHDAAERIGPNSDVVPLCLTCPGACTYPCVAGAFLRPWLQQTNIWRRRLARLDQHFGQTSFAEFTMLMTFDDEVLKRYGLPKSMVERALIKVYETVVLDQQR